MQTGRPADPCLVVCGRFCVRRKMDKENDFVRYFYKKYKGRVALGVGYNENLTEIFSKKYR